MIPTAKQTGFKEWIVTIITTILVGITVATYILDLHKNNWVCGPALLILEFIAIGLQLILTFAIWRTVNERNKIAVIFLSLGLMTFISYGFVNFLTNCS